MRFLSEAIHDLDARGQRRAHDRHAHAYALGVRGAALIDYAIGKTQALPAMPKPSANHGDSRHEPKPVQPRPSPQKVQTMKTRPTSTVDLARIAAESAAIEKARARAVEILKETAQAQAEFARVATGKPLDAAAFAKSAARYHALLYPTQTPAEEQRQLEKIASTLGTTVAKLKAGQAERDALLKGGK